jgi:hypothetical protein
MSTQNGIEYRAQRDCQCQHAGARWLGWLASLASHERGKGESSHVTPVMYMLDEGNGLASYEDHI